MTRRGGRAFLLPPYIPGKSLEELEREAGIGGAVKLASNENPLGPSPRALEAAARALERSHLYPEGHCPDLRRALAERYGLSPRNVFVSNGADSVLTLLPLAFVEEGEEVLSAGPTFPVYRRAALLAGGVYREIPLEDFRFPLSSLLRAVGPRTRMVFVCNPNNPTGTWVGAEEVEEFLSLLPREVLAVFDEAYIEYAPPGLPALPHLLPRHPNAVSVRTFSKAYGLAGLRVGYALAAEEVVEALDRVRDPFPVSRVAERAALAALGDEGHVARTLALNSEGKDFLCRELERRGWRYLPTGANFLLLHLGRPADPVFQGLLRRGVIVRPGTSFGLEEWIRVTLGRREDLERFLQALDAEMGEKR